MSLKIRSRPAKRSLANAYPAITLKTSDSAVTATASSMLFAR